MLTKSNVMKKVESPSYISLDNKVEQQRLIIKKLRKQLKEATMAKGKNKPKKEVKKPKKIKVSIKPKK